MKPRRICTFTVDHVLLGIDIDDVLEVVRSDVITPVPLAPHSVAGVLNLRGRIVTAIDARQRLALSPSDDASVHIVVRHGDEAVSLLVDRAGEVIEVDDSMVVGVPITVAPTLRSFTTCAYLVDGNALLVLEPDTTLSVASS